MLDRVLDRLGRAHGFGQDLRGGGPSCANPVPHDLVEPPSKVPDLAPAPQRRQRVQERLLDDVLGAPICAQLTSEGEQLPAISADNYGERRLVPGTRQADQAVV
jgi:hypothetical protein